MVRCLRKYRSEGLSYVLWVFDKNFICLEISWSCFIQDLELLLLKEKLV